MQIMTLRCIHLKFKTNMAITVDNPLFKLGSPTGSRMAYPFGNLAFFSGILA